MDNWNTKLLDPNTCDFIPIVQDILSKYNQLNQEVCSELINSINIILNSSHITKILHNYELELLYKVYFKLVGKSTLHNNKIMEIFNEKFNELNCIDRPFLINAILFTNYHKQFNEFELNQLCLQVFKENILINSKNLVIILRAMILYYKKYPNCKEFNITLEDFYFCIQANSPGIREETLLLLESTLIKSEEKAIEFLEIILEFWPWTNKNKFYFLAIIFGIYNFDRFKYFQNNTIKIKFFHGVRMSLTYKNLFSSGQALIKSLSKHKNPKELNLLILDIIKNGTIKELTYLNTQWMSNIQQKDEIFNEVLKITDIENIDNFHFNQLTLSNRYILISYIFKLQISETNLKLFHQITEYYQENCLKYENYTIQLNIYKFLIDSITILDLSKLLKFLSKFYIENLFIPCSEFRNTILCKFPQIFNYLSKKYAQQINCFDNNSMNFLNSLKIFFNNLNNIIKIGIKSIDYQPLIFSLKMFEIILKSLFSETSKRFIKNCNIKQNQNLGNYLLKENCFDFEQLNLEIFELLEHKPAEYDDVRNIIIEILKKLNICNYEITLDKCKISLKRNEIYNCTLSLFYAKLAVHRNESNLLLSNEFYEYCYINIEEILKKFTIDPFLSCKNGNHIFGYLNCLNEIFANTNFSKDLIKSGNLERIIEKLEIIVDLILKMLKISEQSDENKEENSSASFEVMDESLQILIEKSIYKSKDSDDENRKFLLLSFWTTLKACCDLATTLGSHLINFSHTDESKNLDMFEKCLIININVLHKCRHKGAIEAAGLSLGNLVKNTTTLHNKTSKYYEKLFICFSVLFGSVNKISTTRRGAGLSIMFHHILKNDCQRGRPLFQHAITTLMEYVKKSETPADQINKTNCDDNNQQHDNFDALVLHYLCVLVKDTELRDDISEFYDNILIAALKRIEHREWCVRNAALQLFGSTVPKIVGQKQAVETDEPIIWEPTEITYSEIIIKLPKLTFHMLEYCNNNNIKKSNGTIILFLEFLSSIEYLRNYSITINENSLDFNNIPKFVKMYREIFWNFLSHQCEKIRKLSAKCLIRSHDYRNELPSLMLKFIEIIFNINNNSNFQQGILFSLIDGIYKLKHENNIDDFNQFLNILQEYFIKIRKSIKIHYYVRGLLIEFLILAKFDMTNEYILKIITNNENLNKIEDLKDFLKIERNNRNFQNDLWYQKMIKKIVLQN